MHHAFITLQALHMTCPACMLSMDHGSIIDGLKAPGPCYPPVLYLVCQRVILYNYIKALFMR